MIFKIKYFLIFIIIFLIFFSFIYYINNNSNLSILENNSTLYELETINLDLNSNLDFNIFFCKKLNDSNSQNNCLDTLNNIFKNSNKNIKCSIYDLSSNKIKDTLVNNKNTNKIIITDLKRSSSSNSLVADLILDKNTIFYRNQDSINLMHNKFCLVDNNLFVFGSANFTSNGLLKNNNNIIIFNNALVSKDLEILFDNNSFVNNSISNKPINILNSKNYFYYINDLNYFYNFYFIKPYNESTKELENKISNLILDSNISIRCAYFTFTNNLFYNSLLSSKARNKEILLESKNYKTSNFYNTNYKGIDLFLDKNKYNMHNKFCIIDNRYLITGSANFTQSAFYKNYESLLITNNSVLINKYNSYFNYLIK